MVDLANVTVAILTGGLGMRLRPIVSGKPKALAEIHEKPFLEYLLAQLSAFNFKNVVLCTGYLGDQIKEKFGNSYKSLSLSYSQESSPLGTGGAVRLALPLLQSEIVMVMNGDSYCDADLKKFCQFHLEKRADSTILLTKVSNTSRYGSVEVRKDGQIIRFQEKKENGGAGFINAGIYLFKRALLLQIPQKGAVSFEKEIFPNWIGKNLYGFKSKGKFIDIGIPEAYSEAEHFFFKNPL